MRKEEYEIPRTPPDSPFRNFDVKCAKCRSYKITITPYYDEQSGSAFIVFFCTRCRRQEQISIKI